jgi:hypothetical protein
LLFAKIFLDHGFSLQKIRQALTEVEHIMGDRHFARQNFFLDEKNIYLKVKESGDAILQLLSKGQWAIPEVIKQTADEIEFDIETGFARKWYPPGYGGLIVLDPNVAFGAPSLLKRGIPTSNVYDLYLAEGEEPYPVCSWLEIEEREVATAVQFEQHLVAA